MQDRVTINPPNRTPVPGIYQATQLYFPKQTCVLCVCVCFCPYCHLRTDTAAVLHAARCSPTCSRTSRKLSTQLSCARFHLVPYSVRVWACTVLLVLSLVTVGYGGSTGVQLLGVCFSSLQGGLGEASFLALASYYDTPRALTAWSSGTGFAGIFGYAWVFVLNLLFGLSFRTTLMMANLLAVFFLYAYFRLLSAPLINSERHRSSSGTSSSVGGGGNGNRLSQQTRVDGIGAARATAYSPLSPSSQQQMQSSALSSSLTSDGGGGALYSSHSEDEGGEEEGWGESDGGTLDVGVVAGESRRPPEMTVGERLRFTLSLWRFTVPLMLVYFAEVKD